MAFEQYLKKRRIDLGDYLELLDSGHWTVFEDAFADGKTKFHGYEHIFVEGSENVALDLFKEVTKIDPKKVTCTCCGQHYSIREYDSVFQATGSLRNCHYDRSLQCYVEEKNPEVSMLPYVPLEDFLAEKKVLIIFANQTLDRPILTGSVKNI